MDGRLIRRVIRKNYKDVGYTFDSIEGVTRYKDIIWSGDGDKPDVATLKKLIDKVEKEDKKNEYKKTRENQYLENELFVSNLIVALWEKIVEGRSEGADKIQKIRTQIKKDIPKPKD